MKNGFCTPDFIIYLGIMCRSKQQKDCGWKYKRPYITYKEKHKKTTARRRVNGRRAVSLYSLANKKNQKLTAESIFRVAPALLLTYCAALSPSALRRLSSAI